jgi:acyl-CoA dehydrogenase
MDHGISTLDDISAREDLRRRAEIVATTAAKTADAVDRGARFPVEAISAARTQRLLGCLVPANLGGEEASISDVVDVCYVLGRACASSAMIFAMHQIMVAILVRHARNSPWHRGLLRRIAAEQLLLASSTTEGKGGGDLRASDCAVERSGSRMQLAKSATVVSYGAEADGILTTARHSVDAQPSNQVLVAFLKDDYQLKPIGDWDALGMRGTCSAGFMLTGSGDVDQVLAEAYQSIHTRTMMPVAHLTWGGVWAGLAAGAVDRARRFIRTSTRQGSGQLPPGAAHLTRAIASLRVLRASLASALRRFEQIANDADELDSLDFQTSMNLLKVNASELAVTTVMSCMHTCGIAGYRNSGEFSISRYLRDVLSSPIMINNDRVLANTAGVALLVDIPSSLTD